MALVAAAGERTIVVPVEPFLVVRFECYECRNSRYRGKRVLFLV